MNGAFEFFPQGEGVFSRDARHQNRLSVFQKLGGDFDDLHRCLTRSENDFGEIFPERAMGVNLGKAKIRHRGGLEGAQDGFARDGSGAELVQQLTGFGGGHTAAVPDSQQLYSVSK